MLIKKLISLLLGREDLAEAGLLIGGRGSQVKEKVEEEKVRMKEP